MALRKVKSLPDGYDVEYWRVNPVMSVNMVGRVATSNLLAYKDATARAAGKQQVELRGEALEGWDGVRSVVLGGTAFDDAMETGDLRDAMYAQLKTLDFFTGSEDV